MVAEQRQAATTTSLENKGKIKEKKRQIPKEWQIEMEKKTNLQGEASRNTLRHAAYRALPG
jgi:hypothetical protein